MIKDLRYELQTECVRDLLEDFIHDIPAWQETRIIEALNKAYDIGYWDKDAEIFEDNDWDDWDDDDYDWPDDDDYEDEYDVDWDEEDEETEEGE